MLEYVDIYIYIYIYSGGRIYIKMTHIKDMVNVDVNNNTETHLII